MRGEGAVRGARRSLTWLAVVALVVVLQGCDAAPVPEVGTGDSPSATIATDPSMTAPSVAPSTTMATRASTSPEGPGLIRHPAGVTFLRPEGWHEAGATLGSAFATDADCRAAVIVDQEPPIDPGQAAFLLQSVVQVCAQPGDGRSLVAYLEAAYGTGLPGFSPATLGGLDGYRTGDGSNQLIFVQTDGARFQVATSVEAEPDLEEERTRQVSAILDSVDFS